MKKSFPIAKPNFDGEESALVLECLQSGWVMQGPRVAEFEKAFAAYTGAQFAVAVSSGTAALHCALKAVGVGPGDVVLTVSHSFIATANSVRLCGAEPLFVDIEPRGFNLCPKTLSRKIESAFETRGSSLYYRDTSSLKERPGSPLRTVESSACGRLAALMPVHQIGVPCDIAAVVELGRQYGIPVVEDAACAVGSSIVSEGKDLRIGLPHGDIACFSFHPRKILTTGDGGMITTRDETYAEAARLMRNHGMQDGPNGTQLFPVTGANYRMTDIQASLGVAQLRKLRGTLESRETVRAHFEAVLARSSHFEIFQAPTGVRWNVQSLPLLLSPRLRANRRELMALLADAGITTKEGIMNAHEQPAYPTGEPLPNSEEMSRAVLFLPIYPAMTREDVEFICARLHEFARPQQ